MRTYTLAYILAAGLAGCTQARADLPGWTASATVSGSGSTLTTGSTLAQCQALTPVEGDVCWPTDSGYTLVCRADGTWSYRWPGIGFDVTPPSSTGWTAYNSGSVAADGGTRLLSLPAETVSGGYRGEYRARPSDPTTTPYTVEACFETEWLGGGTSGHGSVSVGHTNATAGHILYAGGGLLSRAIFSNLATATYVSSQDISTHDFGRPICLRLREDGTNREHFMMAAGSASGASSQIGTSTSRTGTFTADSVGWWGIQIDADGPRTVRLVHWAEATE